MIDRYRYLVHNVDNLNLLESLPLSLSYEVSKQNAPIELVEKVHNGDIVSLKAWNEEKAILEEELRRKSHTIEMQSDDMGSTLKKLHEAERKHAEEIKLKEDEAQSQRQMINLLSRQREELQSEVNNRATTKEQVIKEVVVEKIVNVPDTKTAIQLEEQRRLNSGLAEDLRKTNSLNHKLMDEIEAAEKKQAEYESLGVSLKDKEKILKEISDLKDKYNSSKRQLNDLREVMTFLERAKKFIKEDMMVIPTLTLMPEFSDNLKSEFRHVLQIMDDWQTAVKSNFKL